MVKVKLMEKTIMVTSCHCNKYSKYLSTSIIMLALILFNLRTSGLAQTQSRLINFQGKLTGQQGEPLDGTYTVIFSIYATATGDTALWTERHENLSVSSGLVNVLLGNIVDLDGPPKVEFNEPRYLGITIDVDNNENSPDPEMLPRQKIIPAIYAYDAENAKNANKAEVLTGDQTEYLVPKGAIIMWSGAISNIPTGWALCDGTKGTPDLRDRFILGAALGHNPGATGGTNSFILNVAQLPVHAHSGSTSSAGSHSHSASISPNPHDHFFRWQPKIAASGSQVGLANAWGSNQSKGIVISANLSVSVSDNGSHYHSFTTNSVGSGAAIDNRPAYYALAFIMKL